MFTSPNFTTERRGLPEDSHDNRGNSGKNHLDAINKQLLMIKNIELFAKNWLNNRQSRLITESLLKIYFPEIQTQKLSTHKGQAPDTDLDKIISS